MNESLSEWNKFVLLLWKNLRAYWNHPTHFLLAIILPTLFTSVLVLMRHQISPKDYVEKKYEEIDIELAWNETLNRIRDDTESLRNRTDFYHNRFLPNLTVAYAPMDKEIIEKIMKNVHLLLNNGNTHNVAIAGYKKPDEVRKAVVNESYFAGIDFSANNDLFNRDPKSKESTDFTFTLMFPSELRFYNDTFIGADWSTDMLYDRFAGDEHRFPSDYSGGYVGYVREGFVMLQNAVSLSFIKEFMEVEGDIPKIKLERFPYHAHTQDPLTERMEIYLAFIVLTGFLYPCMFITWVLSKEKATTMKEVIKMYGINYFIQFCAWFFYGMLIFFAANIILIAILKIPWHEGEIGIITNCSWVVLLIFLTSYSAASVSFCFMVTSFCKRSHTAIIMLGLLWIATFLPLIIKVNQAISDTFSVWIIMHFFSNTAMASAFLRILEYEQYSDGFRLKNFFVSQNYDDKITVGVTTLLLLAHCVIYTIIGIYVDKINPGAYGIGSNWIYIFSKRDRRRSSEKKRSSPMRQTKVFEVEPQYKKLNVQIEKLCKTSQGDVIINDIYMNFFENEIVVLMGANGSGKTTLIMMIIGLLKPTSGIISIYGFDILKNKEIARSYLGICLQQNMVLPDLSAAEQLRFYCYLKGMKDKKAIEREIVHYLKCIELSDSYHVYTRRLSSGNTRLLSVCCALCGDSEIVVLDMPSVGMDLATRKILWRLLLKEKHRRTIILTTHCSAEAEALADRVAIISGGELKCMGTTYFLKNMYGFGHRLVCAKGEKCDVDKVTVIVRKIVPGAKPESNIGVELSYRLKLENTQTFAKILNVLEQHSEELDLHGFYITNTTIDDICLSFGTSEPSEGEAIRHSEIVNGLSEYIDNYDDLDFLKPYTPYEGCRLLCNHWKALLYERFLYSLHMRALWIELIILPSIIIAAVIFISQHSFEVENLPTMVYRFDRYADTVTPLRVEENVDATKLLAERYETVLSWMALSHNFKIVNETLTEFMLHMQDSESADYKKYLIGASFWNEKYVAYFNNFALHSVPLSLGVLHNAILNQFEKHSSIRVKLEPVGFIMDYHAEDMRNTSSSGNFVASTISYCVIFVYSFPIMYIIRERQARLKLIKQISGLRPLMFWTSSFTFDLIVSTMCSIILLAIIYFYQLFEILWYDLAIDFALILFLFGITIMPFNYLMSEFFDNYILGYFASIIFYIFGDIALAAVVDGVERDYNDISTLLDLCFRINPYFALSRAFYKAYRIGLHRFLCGNDIIRTLSVDLGNCAKARPNCCVDHKVLTWDSYGVLPEVASFFVLALVCIIIIAIKEIYRSYFSSENPDPDMTFAPGRSSQTSDERKISFDLETGLEQRRSSTSADLDTSAFNERSRVLSLKHDQLNLKPLVLNKFTKRYKNVVAANRLYLVIDQYDSVGLIGQNGDGKSSILKVLSGEEKLTSGSAYVQGINVITHLYDTYQHIGYCPENTTFLEQLTVYQVMKVLSMLHGIPSNEIEQRCESLAKAFGFYEDFDKKFDIVSYGNRRRLSVAIAFLGNPSIIYLDTPFKCVDPAGMRQQWNIFNIVRQAGKALFIASCRPRECSMISTRFVVISHGSFQWLGTVHDIKRLLPKNYLLRIKIKPYAEESDNRRSDQLSIASHVFQATPYSRILLFVENEFHNSFLTEENGLVLFFQIPMADTNLSEIYLKIHASYINIYIEDFTVSHGRLAVELMDMVDHVVPAVGPRRQSSFS